DTLVGNSGNDTLVGGVGADMMTGGAGDDVYYLDSNADRAVETTERGSGTDTVVTSGTATMFRMAAGMENLFHDAGTDFIAYGNGAANQISTGRGDDFLSGDLGNDTLDGGAGADRMNGGEGNDTFVVDAIGDRVVEAVDHGIDSVRASVSFRLSDTVENLVLTGTSAINGTGNAGVNRMVGNDGRNVLDGGAGADVMSGGAGDDTYLVDNAGDVVIEAAMSGTDTVISSLNHTLRANVENLTLTGSATEGTGNGGANTITGNDLANKLYGAGGNDLLISGAGRDTLTGGTGDDRYVIEALSDVIVELANEGTDTVQIDRSYGLGANLERLVLTGVAAINGTGNELNNGLRGNEAANVLNGGLGSDTLTGAGGADAFVFGVGLADGSIDVITDFDVTADLIWLNSGAFRALTAGALPGSAFSANTTGLAGDEFDRIIYETDTGKLMYDRDGNGGGAAVQFATLQAGLALTAADFLVI
ncbi:MAG: calcium-binding protein, partial [Paracoccaceae bacterium]